MVFRVKRGYSQNILKFLADSTMKAHSNEKGIIFFIIIPCSCARSASIDTSLRADESTDE